MRWSKNYVKYDDNGKKLRDPKPIGQVEIRWGEQMDEKPRVRNWRNG